MAVLVNLASQAYAVGQQTFPITVAAGITSLSAVLTRSAWPSGAVATVAIIWSDGNGATFTLTGGTVLDRAGNVLAATTVIVSKAAGITQGTVTVNVLQPLTTALTVTSQ